MRYALRASFQGSLLKMNLKLPGFDCKMYRKKQDDVWKGFAITGHQQRYGHGQGIGLRAALHRYKLAALLGSYDE